MVAFDDRRKTFYPTLTLPLQRGGKTIITKLRKYADGKKVKFNEPLSLYSGSAFEKKVWRAISKIPWGETRSYSWLAKKAGRREAVRAAANACGKNPVPIIIPCHRVIRKDGTIGGFSSGIKIKKRLLKIEKG